MISELIFKTKDLFHGGHSLHRAPYNERYNENISSDRRCFKASYDQRKKPNHKKAMEHRFIDFFCKDIKQQPTAQSQFIHRSLFQDLKSPNYRISLIQTLPVTLSQLLIAYRDHESPQSISDRLILSPKMKHDIVAMANQPPFQSERLFTHYEQVQATFNDNNFSIVVCSCLFKQHCNLRWPPSIEQQLFNDGIRNAYICFCLAQKQKLDALSAFITGFLPFISLIYLLREVERQNIRVNKAVLLNDIAAFLPRFNYWLAKDWGLPENLLMAFREHVVEEETLSPLANIMQTANHAHLTLMLGKAHRMSKTHAQHNIQQMGLDEFELWQHCFKQQH